MDDELKVAAASQSSEGESSADRHDSRLDASCNGNKACKGIEPYSIIMEIESGAF